MLSRIENGKKSYVDKALASAPKGVEKVAKLASPIKEDQGADNKRAIEEAIKKLYPRYKQDYFKEFCFSDNRKFRFDFYIPELKLGIEYDGLFSKKSRHTTPAGFSKDCEKMNLATILGFKTLRYTSINLEMCGQDIWNIKHGTYE